MGGFIRSVLTEVRWQQPTHYRHTDTSAFNISVLPRSWIQQRCLQLVHEALQQPSPQDFLRKTSQHLFEFAVLLESLEWSPTNINRSEALIQALSDQVGPRRSSAIAHALSVLRQAQTQIETCRELPPASREQDALIAQGFNATLVLFRWLMECAFEATHVEASPPILSIVLNLLVDAGIESSRLAQRCHDLRHSESDRMPMYASG